MIYILTGFGTSVATSETVERLITSIRSDVDVIAIDYPYWDAKRAHDVIDQQIVKDDPDKVFIGISLGGFWARYFANKYAPCKLILINPSIDAPTNVRKYIGQTHGGEQFTQQHCEQLQPFVVDRDDPSLQISVFLSVGDEVIDPKHAFRHYQDRANVQWIAGPHRPQLTPVVIDQINTAINTVVG